MGLIVVQLLRNKRRLLVGLVGVALAVTVLLLIEGFGVGMFRQSTAYVEKNGADLYLGQKGVETLQNVTSMVPQSLEGEIAAIKGVQDTTSIYATPIILDVGDRKTPVTLYGFQPGARMGGPWLLSAGRMLASDDEAVLDRVLAEQNGLDVGDLVGILGKDFKIVGLSAETNAYMNASVFLSEQSVSNRLEAPSQVSFFLIKANDGIELGNLKLSLTKQFPDYSVLTRLEMAKQTRSQLEDVMGAPLTVILGVAFLVGLMVVGLTTYILILEKTREYGVLKAIGARNKVLYTSVLMEALFWAVLGFAAGVLLSRGAAWLIMQGAPELNIAIGFPSLIKALVITFVISILSSLSSVRRVGKLDPAQVFSN